MITPFRDDLYPPFGGRIYTAASGAAPNCVFVIDGCSVGEYPGGTNSIAGNQYSFNMAVLTNNKVLHFWPQ